MASRLQPPKGRDSVVPSLDVAIQALNLAKDTCGIPPAQLIFGSASALLSMIRDSTANKRNYLELGLSCVDVCTALDRGLDGRRLDELSHSVLKAIEQLAAAVAEVQRRIVKQGERNAVSRAFRSKSDKDNIDAWRQEFDRILQIFNTELAINTHTLVVDIHRSVLAGQKGTVDQHQSVQASFPSGEPPPPPPRVCFGRDKLIDEIVGLAINHQPIALIGAGGIGKTSVALTVLHHDRIKDRFGDNRRFIRCDQFPPSRAHLLRQLSRVIGAGVTNPEDLAALRSSLTSREMILFLDNAEFILDPQGTDARGIYSVVEELSCFKNICLGITSRISTVPPHCKRPIVSTLSAGSACDIFYSIYGNRERSDIINDLVKQLDFHALSITLLATTASHNTWNYDRLAKEWNTHRARVLRTDHDGSLAASIQLSLASPTFHNLVPSTSVRKPGASRTLRKLIPPSTFRKIVPSAHDLLEVVAFYPQGIDEKNLDWFFPTVPDRENIFDKFCVLSLTYRNNGFITMLAPIRDHFRPRDPKSSPLLRATKDCYVARLLVCPRPGRPGFGQARWITSEDVNVEHLLDVFTSTSTNPHDVWDACSNFIDHLYYHKPRPTILMSKVEGLPDDHRSKPDCLFELSGLFEVVGNHSERKRLLTHALMLEKQRGDGSRVARTLGRLSDANRLLGLHEEGIQQAKEASETFKRLGDRVGQARCLMVLASSLLDNNQLDAAEDAVSGMTDLLPGKGQEDLVCRSHRLLGLIYFSKKEKEKAIHHFEAAIGIASRFGWHDELFWNHYNLANLFRDEDEFNDANAHIERAKPHAVSDTYCLGRAMEMQAEIWYQQYRFEDATFEALRALGIYKKVGATKDADDCKYLIQRLNNSRKVGSRFAVGTVAHPTTEPVASETPTPDLDGYSIPDNSIFSLPNGILNRVDRPDIASCSTIPPLTVDVY